MYMSKWKAIVENVAYLQSAALHVPFTRSKVSCGEEISLPVTN